jgi:hypothetical protein
MSLRKMMAEIGLDGSGFAVGAKKVESETAKLAGNIKNSLGNTLTGILGVAFFEQAIQKTIEFGSEISDLAKRAGVTAEAFQKMSFAFGGNKEGVSSFFDKLNENRAKALQGGVNSPESQAFGKLGIGQSELSHDTGEVLMSKIGDAIKAGNIQELIGPLRVVGGRGAGELVAGFKAGIEERAKDAVAAGAIMSNADVARMKQIQKEWSMLTTSLMVDMVPIVDTVIRSIEDLISRFKILGAFIQGLFVDPERVALDKQKIVHAKEVETFAAWQKSGGEYEGHEFEAYKKAQEDDADAGRVTASVMHRGNKWNIFENAMQAASDEQARQDGIQKAREKAIRDAAGKQPEVPVDFGETIKNKRVTREETTWEKMSLTTDALNKMGGFVGGAGMRDAIGSIARRQLEVTETMAGGIQTSNSYLNGILQKTGKTTPGDIP